ncbi:MAG: hypothetical protein ACTS80_00305 [Candidatus Hodgkinia cicadicola]
MGENLLEGSFKSKESCYVSIGTSARCFGCLSGSEVINGEEASNEQSEGLLRCNDVRFNRKSGRRLLQCWRPRLLIRRGKCFDGIWLP